MDGQPVWEGEPVGLMAWLFRLGQDQVTSYTWGILETATGRSLGQPPLFDTGTTSPELVVPSTIAEVVSRKA